MLYVFSNDPKTIKKVKDEGLQVIFANPRWLSVEDFKGITKKDKIGIDETSKSSELLKEFVKDLGVKPIDYSINKDTKKDK